MNLSESVYTIPAAESHEARIAQYAEFLEKALGLTISEEYTEHATSKGTVYWLDEKKTVGFAAAGISNSTSSTTISKSGIVPYYNGRVIYYVYGKAGPDGYLSNFNTELKIYYQKSKSGNAIYFRVGTDDKCKMIAAKDTSGDWHIIQYGVLFSKNGSVDVQCNAVISNNSLFTAVKMPAIVTNAEFIELYKIISATTFLEANTYVNFNGKPYKVISTGGQSILPCFAFPVEG